MPQVGLVSKLFRISFYAGQYRRRFKAWNKTAYNITRIALVIALIAFVIWI